MPSSATRDNETVTVTSEFFSARRPFDVETQRLDSTGDLTRGNLLALALRQTQLDGIGILHAADGVRDVRVGRWGLVVHDIDRETILLREGGDGRAFGIRLRRIGVRHDIDDASSVVLEDNRSHHHLPIVAQHVAAEFAELALADHVHDLRDVGVVSEHLLAVDGSDRLGRDAERLHVVANRRRDRGSHVGGVDDHHATVSSRQLLDMVHCHRAAARGNHIAPEVLKRLLLRGR